MIPMTVMDQTKQHLQKEKPANSCDSSIFSLMVSTPFVKNMSLNGHFPQMGIRNLWNWGYAKTSVNHQPWLPTNPWLRSCTTTYHPYDSPRFMASYGWVLRMSRMKSDESYPQKKCCTFLFQQTHVGFWPFLDVIHRTQSYIIHTPKNRDLYYTNYVQLPRLWWMLSRTGSLILNLIHLDTVLGSVWPFEPTQRYQQWIEPSSPSMTPCLLTLGGKSTCDQCFKLLTQHFMDISRRTSGSSCFTILDLPQIMLIPVT